MKTRVEFKNNELEFGLDANEDGQEVLKAKLNLVEALQEAIKRQDSVPGVKLVDVKFQFTKLVVVIDSDQDGERLIELEVDLAEALDEAGIMKI